MEIDSSLSNKLLIAMPGCLSEPFNRSVIYICEHHVQGTVGLIVNHPTEHSLKLVFDQLKITSQDMTQQQTPLLIGGPLQPERGFVLHKPMGSWQSSLMLRKDVTVTTSNDIIYALARNEGPSDALVTVGFSAWGPEQLEQEIQNNTWLVAPYKPELLYEIPFHERWEYAGSLIGVKMNNLVTNIGHA